MNFDANDIYQLQSNKACQNLIVRYNSNQIIETNLVQGLLQKAEHK